MRKILPLLIVCFLISASFLSVEAQVLCDDTTVSPGTPMGSNNFCVGQLTDTWVSGAVIPEEGLFGFVWAVSSADISGVPNPILDPSYFGSFTAQATVPTDSLTFPHDLTNLPAGTYYFTPVVFGNAVDTGAVAGGFNNFVLEEACTFTGMSFEINLLVQGDPFCTVAPACDTVTEAPANDDCVDAVSIVAGENGPYENCLAGIEPTDPQNPVDGAGNICWVDDTATPLGTSDNTVWFTYTGAGVQVNITATDCSGTLSADELNNDTQFAVYTACPGDGGTLITCNEDISAANFQSTVSFGGEAGVTYWLVVDGWLGTAGSFCLEVEELSCIPPTATVTATECEDGQFTVDVDITDLGSFASIDLDVAGVMIPITAPTPIGGFGPFDSGVDVLVTLSTGNADCDLTGTVTQVCASACDIAMDGSFELGSGSGAWTEASTNFGTPLCNPSCFSPAASGANTGDWWVWFGGINAFEEGTVTQVMTIPSGPTVLSFFLSIPAAAGTGNDFFEAQVDGDVVFSVTDADAASYPTYTLVEVDISDYADGGAHTIILTSTVNGGGTSNFFVDDVVVDACGAVCQADAGTLDVPDETVYCTGAVFTTNTLGDEFTGDGYTYIYILAETGNGSIANTSVSGVYPPNTVAAGSYDVYGLSFLGSFSDFEDLGASTVGDIEALLTVGLIDCAELSAPYGITVDAVCVGIDSPSANPNFAITQIAPMPTSDFATVNYTIKGNNTAITLSIYDVTGKLMRAEQLTALNGANTYQLDASTFAAGMYVLHLTNGTDMVSAKFVKE